MFKNNLAALKRTNPALAAQAAGARAGGHCLVVNSRTGQPVLKVFGRAMHSTYDPVAEGRQWAEKNLKENMPSDNETLIIYGLGFAYHIAPLIGAVKRCVVIEPGIDILVLAMQYIDLTEIFSNMCIIAGDSTCLETYRPYRIWKHGPTASANRASFGSMETQRSGRCGPLNGAVLVKKQKLNIMVVSPIYGGSLPIARYCADAFSNLGHDAHLWDASIFYKPFKQVLDCNIDEPNKKVLYDLFLHLISEMVVASCSEQKPDMILALAQAPLSTDALRRFKENRIATAYWFVEDFRLMQYWKKYASHYDAYFTIQDGVFFDALEAAGAENYHYLPLAASPTRHVPLTLSSSDASRFGCDISFMGAGYHNRQELFKCLLDYNFKIWGTGWDRRSLLWSSVQDNAMRISEDDIVKIYNASKININLHSSVSHEGVNPTGDFLNPRTFEIASCGAFQLVDFRSKLPESFDIGTEMICYKDAGQLRSLIDYYINRPEKRAKVAEAARKRVAAEHTYESRMSDMIAVMQEARPDCFYKSTHGSAAIGSVESFCKAHPETASVLDEFAGTGSVVDIDDVAGAIRSKKGDIQYHEAIFLLMQEFKNHFAGKYS